MKQKILITRRLRLWRNFVSRASELGGGLQNCIGGDLWFENKTDLVQRVLRLDMQNLGASC